MSAANSNTPAIVIADEAKVPAIVIADDSKVPAIVIAAPGSGSGKTSISIGLAAALRAEGEAVQCFKVGPDYLDPTFLSMASGRQCWNLDSWMTTHETVRNIYYSQCASASFAIAEGVMGLFDGASPEERTGSTAEIAALLQLPVLLVIDVGGQARSAAAVVQGFVNFDPEIQIAGVIANYCGSAGHADIIRRALASANLPPLVGWFQKQSLPALPERHLGLHAAHRLADGDRLVSELGAACAAALDLPRIRELAAGFAAKASANTTTQAVPTNTAKANAENADMGERPRIGIARDEAFYFYYPDNLAALEAAGAELVEFSPLADAQLPDNLSGIYIGGGYPEEFAAGLAANTEMRAAIRAFAEAGVVYAECGGLMYLSETLVDRDAEAHAMVGLLPFSTRMLPRRKMLGYVEIELSEAGLLGASGQRSRGHEFHYSEIITDQFASGVDSAKMADTDEDRIQKNIDAHLSAHGFRRVARLHGRRSKQPRSEGFQSDSGQVFASYVHQHFASNPDLAQNIVRAARAASSRTELSV